MNVYEVRFDSDRYPRYYANETEDLSLSQAMSEFSAKCKQGESPAAPTGLTLSRVAARKSQKDASFVQVNLDEHFIGIRGETLERLCAVGFLQRLVVDLTLDDNTPFDVCISLPWIAAFPEHAHHKYRNDDIFTDINEDAVTRHPIFRGSIYGYQGRVPSPRKYATQAFKDLYEREEWSGLLFEQVFPLMAAIDRIVERQAQRRVQSEIARMLREKASSVAESALPIGKPAACEITWANNQQPSPEQLARYLWQRVIDSRMTGHWQGSAIENDLPGAAAITNLGARAVQILTSQRCDPNVLNHLARAVAFETIAETLMALEDVDFLREVDADFRWEDIEFELTHSATRDLDGNIGGWPPA